MKTVQRPHCVEAVKSSNHETNNTWLGIGKVNNDGDDDDDDDDENDGDDDNMYHLLYIIHIINSRTKNRKLIHELRA